MNTDRLTTILGLITSLAASGAAAAAYFGYPLVTVGLGALAAASHAAQGYITNKQSSP